MLPSPRFRHNAQTRKKSRGERAKNEHSSDWAPRALQSANMAANGANAMGRSVAVLMRFAVAVAVAVVRAMVAPVRMSDAANGSPLAAVSLKVGDGGRLVRSTVARSMAACNTWSSLPPSMRLPF